MTPSHPYLKKLPKSSKRIITILADTGSLTQKEIIEISRMPAKTARYALKRLSEESIIVTKPNLVDMRSSNYMLSPDLDFNLMNAYVADAIAAEV